MLQNTTFFFHYLSGLKIKPSLTEIMLVTKNERQLEEVSLNFKKCSEFDYFSRPHLLILAQI